MTPELEKIISEKVKNFPKEDIKFINESINTVLESKLKELEEENSTKFKSLVENITSKFDEKVTGVISESVKGNIGNTINKKMYDLVKDMVNLLESSGITITEKTKELNEKLKKVNGKLEEVWNEREEIKNKLSASDKENYILSQLKGMKPEIINSALDYFKDKDLLDVQDGLKAYLDGDFSNLSNGDTESPLLGTINLDQVRDALDEIDTKHSDVTKAAQMESLNKGLKSQKIVNSPNVTEEDLAKPIVESQEGHEDTDDTQEAMKQITDFNNLGYSFR